MAQIRYLVPVEVTLRAIDTGSGKPVANIMYFRNGVAVAPPAYGTPIPGATTATFLANLRTIFNIDLLPLLNHNYAMQSYSCRSIMGKRYGTPLLALSAVVAGTPVTISTSAPHGLVTGDLVVVAGVTTPTGVNGQWLITKIDDHTMELVGSTAAGAWSGTGTVQSIAGPLQFLYDEADTLPAVGDIGGVAGDALPLFCTASVRRINSGAGRNWRSRLSFSPLSEVDSLDGGFTVATKANWLAGLTHYHANPPANGAAAGTGATMFNAVVSRQLAMAMASPFTNSNFCTESTSWILQRNTGSLTRRKPRLTAIVT